MRGRWLERVVSATLAVVVVLFSAVVWLPGVGARAESGACIAREGTAVRTCALSTEGTAEHALDGPSQVDAYLVVVPDFGATIHLELGNAPGGYRVRLVDWSAMTLAEAVAQGPEQAAVAERRVDAPGTYYVLVDVPAPERLVPQQPYRLQSRASSDGPPRRVVFSTDGGLVPSEQAGDRPLPFAYQVTTPRGGTLSAGVAAARALPLQDAIDLADFALTADIRVERADGPSAATVRFRYQPEAGGGSGYLLSVDPLAGQVRLATFDEGRQVTLVPWTLHPAARVGAERMRVTVQATGAVQVVYVNGEEVARTTNEAYRSGLIALGATTWSAPVTVTFEHILVTVPSTIGQ